jgi:hypothetical protein
MRIHFVMHPSTNCERGLIFMDIKSEITYIINHLKPTGYVMHHHFIIPQPYVLPTLYLCVLYLSENKQRLVPLTE